MSHPAKRLKQLREAALADDTGERLAAALQELTMTTEQLRD
jgi:hypothetical protein